MVELLAAQHTVCAPFDACLFFAFLLCVRVCILLTLSLAIVEVSYLKWVLLFGLPHVFHVNFICTHVTHWPQKSLFDGFVFICSKLSGIHKSLNQLSLSTPRLADCHADSSPTNKVDDASDDRLSHILQMSHTIREIRSLLTEPSICQNEMNLFAGWKVNGDDVAHKRNEKSVIFKCQVGDTFAYTPDCQPLVSAARYRASIHLVWLQLLIKFGNTYSMPNGTVCERKLKSIWKWEKCVTDEKSFANGRPVGSDDERQRQR